MSPLVSSSLDPATDRSRVNCFHRPRLGVTRPLSSFRECREGGWKRKTALVWLSVPCSTVVGPVACSSSVSLKRYRLRSNLWISLAGVGGMIRVHIVSHASRCSGICTGTVQSSASTSSTFDLYFCSSTFIIALLLKCFYNCPENYYCFSGLFEVKSLSLAP